MEITNSSITHYNNLNSLDDVNTIIISNSNNKPLQPTICLNMIVKNESKIITRMLESVCSIIDTYLICDTGSTDNTIEIIKTFFNNKGIPGEITEIPFKNFGYNRTMALKPALKKADYVLLLDADMRIVIEPYFTKSMLVDKAYLLLQKNPSISWWNTRIIHKSVDATCVGPTHEYYDLPGGINSKSLNGIWIDDIGDGGCKIDKFDRDIRLLKEGLEESPNNARYLFYLANSYFNSGRNEESIPYYKKRIEVGGWYEEVWYSYYNLGFVYQKTGRPEIAITTWLEGYNFHQQRSENIYEIVKWYRERGLNKIAQVFCDIAKSIPYPNNDKLFINDKVYQYLIDYEQSIIGFYTQKPDMDTLTSQILNKTMDYNTNLLSNYKFYAKKLQNFSQKIHRYTSSEIMDVNGDDQELRSCNPCVFKTNDGELYMNIRMVNYLIHPDGTYDVKGSITTFNKLVKLDDKTFKKVKDSEITFIPSHYNYQYSGLEDVKIAYNGNGELVFVGTTQAPFNDILKLTIHYGVYDMTGSKASLEYTPVNSPNNRGCEKNWVLIGRTNKVIYEWHPMTIGEIVNPTQNDTSTTTSISNTSYLNFNKLETKLTPLFFKNVRGSTNGYEFNNEIWFICHVVDYDKPRFYYHCLVVLDKELNILRWSNLFTFEGQKIEYTLGLVVEEERLLISYSTWDRTVNLGIYNKRDIENTLIIHKP